MNDMKLRCGCILMMRWICAKGVIQWFPYYRSNVKSTIRLSFFSFQLFFLTSLTLISLPFFFLSPSPSVCLCVRVISIWCIVITTNIQLKKYNVFIVKTNDITYRKYFIFFSLLMWKKHVRLDWNLDLSHLILGNAVVTATTV